LWLKRATGKNVLNLTGTENKTNIIGIWQHCYEIPKNFQIKCVRNTAINKVLSSQIYYFNEYEERDGFLIYYEKFLTSL
jgi:hypothetical protein